jgi:transposase
MALDEKPEGYVFGRPTGYRPEYCDKVIEWGRLGKSRAWIAAEIGVCKQTLANWEAQHPDFLVALRRAKVFEQQWWEDAGQTSLGTREFQANVWSRSMAARFPDDWRETSRQEQTGANGGPIKVEASDAVAELTRRLARLSATAATGGDAEGSQ